MRGFGGQTVFISTADAAAWNYKLLLAMASLEATDWSFKEDFKI